MTAAAYDLKIEQGEDYMPRWVLRFKGTDTPRNLAGWTGHLQIRSIYYATSTLIDLTTSNGGLTLGADGSIQINMTAAQTAAFFTGPSPNPVWQKINDRPYTKIGQYDLRLFDTSGKTFPIIGGNVLLTPSVTRPA
jgi:hypothetical protein